MLLGKGGSHKRGSKRGAPPLKRRYFTDTGSSNVKMVADKHRHAAYHAYAYHKALATSFLGMSTSMTLNDLEPPKIGVIVNFSRFWTATRISRVNCAEMAGDRLRQPACEIFSIECRFQQSTYGPCRFKGACTHGCQKGVPL